MTTAIHTTVRTSERAASALAGSTITISTAPLLTAHRVDGRGGLDGVVSSLNPSFGAAAWVLAAVVGIVLGIAIGLVSAGFDTTRLLLAVGAVALGIGWLIAVLTSPSVIDRARR